MNAFVKRNGFFEDFCPNCEDPFKWWSMINSKQDSVICLAKFSASLFALSPHVADLERFFSTLGYTHSKSRSNMSPLTLKRIGQIRTILDLEKPSKLQNRIPIIEIKNRKTDNITDPVSNATSSIEHSTMENMSATDNCCALNSLLFDGELLDENTQKSNDFIENEYLVDMWINEIIEEESIKEKVTQNAEIEGSFSNCGWKRLIQVLSYRRFPAGPTPADEPQNYF